MHTLKIIFLLNLLMAGTLGNMKVMAQDERLFDRKEPLEIRIRTDLIKLLASRDDEDDYQEAMIRVILNSEEIIELPVGVKTRGNFRRDSSNCDFPPIRLNFKKSHIKDHFFEGNEKIKIVTHCKTAVPEFEQFIAREFITYRLYNLITPISFQVRFARITYEDTGGQLEAISRSAFLIEDIDNLAARNNKEEYEGSLSIDKLQQGNAVNLSLFQYMIGNTDWIVGLSKNLKLVKDSSDYYAVPYDFDYTALVGTDYSLGGNSTFLTPPERKYKGKCYSMEEVQKAAGHFLEQKKEMLRTIRKSDHLDYTSRQHMVGYISDFFYVIRSDKRIREEILAPCITGKQ